MTNEDQKTLDPVVEAVRSDLLSRSQLGIAKYGVTLARADLSLRDWLQHAYEETLDQANYLKRSIMQIDAGSLPPAPEVSKDGKIARLIEKAKEIGFTDAMAREQRKSWVIGEMMLASPWLTYDECERRYQQAIGGR